MAEHPVQVAAWTHGAVSDIEGPIDAIAELLAPIVAAGREAAITQLRADLAAETALRQERTDLYDLWRSKANQLGAAIARVRDVADRWENALAPDRRYAEALLAALDGPADTTPEAEEHRGEQPFTPPPGSTAEQLPAAVLELIGDHDYLSTACDTAQRLQRAPRPTPTSGGAIPDVAAYVVRLHQRCRLNHKFTGRLCVCACHREVLPGPPPDPALCGLPHGDYPQSLCREPAGHGGPHAARLVIGGEECGAVAWGPDR